MTRDSTPKIHSDLFREKEGVSILILNSFSRVLVLFIAVVMTSSSFASDIDTWKGLFADLPNENGVYKFTSSVSERDMFYFEIEYPGDSAPPIVKSLGYYLHSQGQVNGKVLRSNGKSIASLSDDNKLVFVVPLLVKREGLPSLSISAPIVRPYKFELSVSDSLSSHSIDCKIRSDGDVSGVQTNVSRLGWSMNREDTEAKDAMQGAVVIGDWKYNGVYFATGKTFGDGMANAYQLRLICEVSANVQKGLKELGYNIARIDGVISQEDKNCIERFIAEHNIECKSADYGALTKAIDQIKKQRDGSGKIDE